MTHPDGSNASAANGDTGSDAEATGWRRATPDEERALALTSPGSWLASADAGALVTLEATVAALEERKSQLDAEIEGALADARARGRREVAVETQRAVDLLLEARGTLAERAATAALEVAEALVGAKLSEEPAAVTTLVTRALSADASRAPRRVRVAPSQVGAVRALVDVAVEADPGLAAGDVAVEYSDGQRVQRLPDLLAALLPAVRSHITQGGEDADE